MKDSTPANFPRVPLSEVATVVNGGTPKSKVAEYWGGDVQWLTPKDMGQMEGREVSKTPRTITQAGLKGSSARLVPAGSVILSTRAPIGHLAMNTVPMAFNQGCRGIIPSDTLNPVYLYHFLNMSRDLLNDLGSGTTFKELSVTNLKSVEIPIPPLEEQLRIVAFLDEAFEGLDRARDHAEVNLQNSQELFEQAEVKLFKDISEGATQTTLGQLATFRNGLNYSRSSQGEEVQVVGVGDFQDNFTIPTDMLARTKIDGQLGEDDKLVAGDILAVRSNGNRDLIGRTMLMPEPNEPTSFSGFTIRVRLNNTDVLPEYVCSFLRTRAARAKLTAGGGGANISNLNQRILSAFPIYFPDKSRQNETLAQLKLLRDQGNKLANDYRAKIKDINDLRQSLLQKAFAGELT